MATMCSFSYAFFAVSLLCLGDSCVIALTLLRDLSTPCFLLDVDVMAKTACNNGDARVLPPLRIQNHVFALQTSGFEAPKGYDWKNDATSSSPLHLFGPEPPKEKREVDNSTCYGYIHTRVVRGRTDKFLAQLDVPPCNDNDSSIDSHLVLGLNNHHVISYYWARSAGAGAAMEAPGIVVENGCYLKWAAGGTEGFTDCNSNDGKRSEWVNFVRPGDQVQLRPHRDPAAAMLRFDHVWGVSSAGRPLGAEPYIVGEFVQEEQ